MRYEPNSAGIVEQLQSTHMRAWMANVGAEVAATAQMVSSRATIETDTAQAFGRWVVNITNTAPDALRQEYGGRYTAPLAPLGRALNTVRALDPNRRRR